MTSLIRGRAPPFVVNTDHRFGSRGGIANQFPQPLQVSEYPAVTGLGGPNAGKFVIAWSERGNINARVFTNDGIPLSNETTIVGVRNDREAHAQSIVATPYGFYVAWVNGVVVGNAFEFGINGQHFHLVQQ
jgi:hypothetical protein